MASTTIPAVYYRGGSSKAVFLHEKDIPPAGPARDRLLKRIMGTPDPIQIDGMGGSRVITSKLAIISKSDRPDADVDYTFAQAGISDDSIAYSGNCGNISSAVGPFAISEGLAGDSRSGVSIVDGLETREVRIYNTGTGKVLRSHVPVSAAGSVVEDGNFSIAAVPGTGAPILMDYSKTIGAAHNKGILPTSNVVDVLRLEGREIEATICDVGNITVFISAEDVDLTGSELPDDITGDEEVITRLREVRGRAAQLLSRCTDWRNVDKESPMLPMVAMVSPSPTAQGHVSGRLILDNRCHDSMAGTGAICMAACSRVPGSVVHKLMDEDTLADPTFKICHALGIMPVTVILEQTAGVKYFVEPVFRTLSFVRTARRIMTGSLHIPEGLVDEIGIYMPEAGATPEMEPQDPEETENITEALCSFVATTTFDSIPPLLVPKMVDLLIDHIGVAASASFKSESGDAFLKAIRALNGSDGSATVYAKGKSFSPQYAALLNGAYAHTFDFDDTMAAAVLHPGAAVIPAALAAAEASGATGKTLITAIGVGYEVACRLGRALGMGGYSRGFHNTGTAGIFGAVAAISSIKALPASQVENAFGLAGSKSSGSMQYLHNGSWNKRLHPGFAAHDAFLCVSLAEAGVVGASQSIEGEYGFLHAYSDSANPVDVCKGLGKEWIFTSTSLKPFPGCRMTHTAVEITARVAAEEKGEGLVPERISVRLSPPCYNIVGTPSANKRHPRTVVDAQFSIYYQIAATWMFGCDLGWEVYSDEKMADVRVAELCDRIEVVSDEEVKDLDVRMEFSGVGGNGLRKESMVHPLGEEENPFSSERVQAKFFGLATPVYGSARAEQIVRAVDCLVDTRADDLMKLLE
ncbi:uncharacterized protein DNG_09745 [Cephalotrichum gorgonifer]|uniref:Uncharacterized protein n=1 Tax=Cephalotrichum gorgonifer TaxID=2041049 RepID=A0AAE8SZJ7_9PEZI|nr:uncharacterized protein DNG_09745 [Cephalotrichum gorgonifer]